MKEEIWKDIPEFGGLYQASTLGRIRSVDRILTVANPTGRSEYKRNHKGVILRVLKDKNGYDYAALYKDGIKSKLQIHRLVAVTFLENPNNYSYVRFKDGDKENTELDNLYWSDEKTSKYRECKFLSML